MSSLRTTRRPGPRVWAEPPAGALNARRLRTDRSLSPSRFLTRSLAPGARRAPAEGPGATASRLRTDAALSRLARIQSRILSRRGAHGGTPDSAPDPQSPPGSPAAAGDSRRFLKRRPPAEQDGPPAAQLGLTGPPDSDEEDARGMPGSPAEPSGSSETPGPQASPGHQDRAAPPPRPPSRPSSPQTPGPCTESPSFCSAVWEPRSGGSPSAASDDSLQDFRPRVLTMEDLDAPSPGPAGAWGPQESPPPRDPAPSPRPPRPRSAPQEAGAPAETPPEGPPTASEVSERLSPPPGSRSSSRGSEATSSWGAPSSPSPPSPSSSSGRRRAPRVRLRDSAVQTLGPSPAPPWTQEPPCPALGAAYVDPVPVAGQLLSADALEALSARSPAALALHELLRQQLNLTRGFVDASRRLHAALLRGLDAEDWCYHSLEEAREFIRQHRPGRPGERRGGGAG
ncbi:uncharacterized protein C19orf44 homolog [Erinaceus europaeus]|uniref:Uncharacterized protein C19orf44 homolog n=1 Tax=Erinaceus europaeus TaxID=9365 RepID=A0ABM3WVZ0_ERIEU|nr:uncharacterized protein C19orf44 homolog [Erinaceus europaeus]